MGARIRRDVDNAVALPEAGRLQVRSPSLAPREELLVRVADIAVHHGLA
jgi:hypothetical protein